MNCSDYHRQLLIDPLCRDADFLAHGATCPECDRTAQEALRFEKRLRAALCSETRGGFCSPSATSFAADRRDPRSSMLYLTLAVGLMLALSLGGWLGPSTSEQEETRPLASVVLGHIEGEIAYLEQNRGLSSNALGSLLALFGAHLAGGGLGELRYAVRCRIRRHYGIHFILAGARGPITVLLMPGEHLSEQQAVDASGFSGLLLPTDYGSMAVVGQPEESLASVAVRIKDAVVWRS